MRQFMILATIAAVPSLFIAAQCQGACPNGSRGTAAASSATSGGVLTAAGLLPNAYFQQAYLQQLAYQRQLQQAYLQQAYQEQIYWQQQEDLANQEQNSRANRLAARQERKTDEKALRAAIKSKKVDRFGSKTD